MLKQFVKVLTPPVMWRMGQRIFGTRNLCFGGGYFSWQSTLNTAGGYDTPEILARVREAALKVKHGEAVFERDSVFFDHEEYRWPTLACLLRVAAGNGGKLRVMDFGGSLGSSISSIESISNHLSPAAVRNFRMMSCGSMKPWRHI